MGLISRVSSRTYRQTKNMTDTVPTDTVPVETAVADTKPEQKGAWGDLLTNIISGKAVETSKSDDESDSDQEVSSEEEEEEEEAGVVNIEKEEKAKKLLKKKEQEAYSSDEDEVTVGRKNERLRKHREWEMIGRVMHPEMNSAKEKRLRRNARIGVVQLFTAVRAHLWMHNATNHFPLAM